MNFKEYNYNYQRNTSSKGAGENGVSNQTGLFDILPDIDMRITNILIITFFVIYYMRYMYNKIKEKKQQYKLKNKKIKEFIEHCIYSNLIFFNFGYQVHEKAFLNISLLTLVYYIMTVFSFETKDKKIYTYSDDISSLALIISLIGFCAQMPLVNDPKDYLVKIGLCWFYYAFLYIGIFNNNDFNSELGTKCVIFIIYIFISCLDFLITFQRTFDFDLNIPGMSDLEKLCVKYPFIFLMGFSCLNSVFVQVVFLLLFT